MNNLKILITRIPADQRKKIVEENIIQEASAASPNEQMSYLERIYKVYIDPNILINCPACRTRILNNFKWMLPLLISIEKEDRLLDA